MSGILDSQRPQILRLRFEMRDLKGELEGDPDQVIKGLLSQLAKVYPTLELAEKLSFNPDLSELAEVLVGIVEFAPEGLLFNVREATSEEAILLSLLGMYVGYRLGKVQDESLSASGLSKATGKAMKTISNQIAWMVDEGLVNRVGRGEYNIASLGIKRALTFAEKVRGG